MPAAISLRGVCDLKACRRRAWPALLVLLLAALPLPAHAAPLAQSSGDPLVLAFYYPWYDESTWSYDRLSDLPAEPYASRDRGVMGRQIDQAKAAGIDAFLVAWYGPGGGPNQTETNLAALLEEANARGFRIGVLFETDGPFFGGVGDVTAALQHVLSVHAGQPAYLRVDGRPVVFFWRPGIYGVDTWRAVRDQSDPGHGAIWISEGTDTSLLAVFDGHHLYSNTWNPPADLTAVNAKFAARVDAARQSAGVGKLWVATVMPGYDDTRLRGGFAQDRQGGAYYAQAWQAAIASRPNWIVINSFNEWPEGSYIEPSAAFGDQYLGLTATYSWQFKAGGGVPVQLPAVTLAEPEPVAQAAALAAPAETATAAPEPAAPTAFVAVDLLNLRGGPGTDFPVVDQAAAGAALPITGRLDGEDGWWQVQAGDAQAWVYGPLVTAGGPLEQVPVIAAAAITQAAPLATTPAAAVTETLPSLPAVAALAGPLPNPGLQPVRPTLSH